MNNEVFDYQNEVLNNNVEGFNFKVNYDIGLKTLIFSLLFYILTNSLVVFFIKTTFGLFISTNIIQTLIFAVLYFIISGLL